MLADGEQEWIGRAINTEHAEELCFWDEAPAKGTKYTLQKWGKVAISSTMKTDGWVTVYKDWTPEN